MQKGRVKNVSRNMIFGGILKVSGAVKISSGNGLSWTEANAAFAAAAESSGACLESTICASCVIERLAFRIALYSQKHARLCAFLRISPLNGHFCPVNGASIRIFTQSHARKYAQMRTGHCSETGAYA